MNLNIRKIANIMVILNAVLMPTQACLVFLFKLPVWAQFLYPMLIISAVICIFIPLRKIVNSIDWLVVLFFILYITTLIISLLLNYDQISEYGTKFFYYVKRYSVFWDSPDMRMFNWGILRPFLFLLYICFLFIFMNFKNSLKVFLKTIVILGLISSLYSCYQIIAAQFGLPFASIFSGHNGEVIYLFGNIRRVEGIFFEAGPQAIFLAPVFLILFLQIFEVKEKLLFNKKFVILSMVPIIITMCFTFSPIAYLTFLLGTSSCVILNYQQISKVISIKKIIKAASIFTIFVLIAYLLLNIMSKDYNIEFSIYDYIKNKIAVTTADIHNVHPDSRSVRNYIGIKIFKTYPIIGCGPAGAITQYSRFGSFTSNGFVFDQTAILNTHLKILCESGIIGFTCYLLIILYPIYLYIKKIRIKKENKSIIDSMTVAYTLHFLLAATANPYFLMAYTWLLYVPLVIMLKDVKRSINE